MKKRLWIAVIGICICVLAACSPQQGDVTATAGSDCTDPEILKKMDVTEGERVVMFPDVTVYALMPGKDFKAAAASAEYVDYLVVSNGKVLRRYTQSPSGFAQEDRYAEPTYIMSRMLQEYLNPEVIRLVSGEIAVTYAAIYKDDFSHYGVGSVVYYETDKGNYVYYCRGQGEEYLMPLEAFQNAVSENQSWIMQLGVYMEFPSCTDISRYNIHSENFTLRTAGEAFWQGNWPWILGGAALLAAGGTVAVICIKRRKK